MYFSQNLNTFISSLTLSYSPSLNTWRPFIFIPMQQFSLHYEIICFQAVMFNWEVIKKVLKRNFLRVIFEFQFCLCYYLCKLEQISQPLWTYFFSFVAKLTILRVISGNVYKGLNALPRVKTQLHYYMYVLFFIVFLFVYCVLKWSTIEDHLCVKMFIIIW